jgi:protein-S-isoprenylcysteine O-methyltransferase Ste14
VDQEPWARLVLAVTVVAFALGEFSQVLKRRPEASPAGRRSEVLFRLALLVGILMLPLARALAPAASLAGVGVFVLGTVVGWLGLWLRWWSFVTLGRYFTLVVLTSADQVVVSRGPYRALRHPAYTGLLAMLLGLGLMLGNWLGTVLAFLVTLLALVYRLLREERAMIDALGDRYREFAAGRARLVPFVW